MINKRYTDEEILKALECCLCDNSECLQCQNKELCKIECDELATKAIDLIISKIEETDRLKTEIGRLQKEVNLVSIQFQDEQERAEEYRLKIENLQNVISNQQIEISAKIENKIKAEAIKEFADMVKKNIKEVWNYDNGTCSCVLVLTKDIDKILKEMVSEND